MTNDEALKAIKDLVEYCTTNSITELKTEEYEVPLMGEGVKTKKITKVEYFIRTSETVISTESINEQIQSIDSQISDLTTQKQEIVSIAEQINTLQN